MENRTLEQIEAEIASTREQLNNVHGTETEVYARIVGYYRAVRNWNKGKADEFKLRKMFTLEDSKMYDISSADKFNCDCVPQNISRDLKMNNVENEQTAATAPVTGNAVSYEMFTRQTCPNCPPVKQYMANLAMNGRQIDADTENGLAIAAAKGVFATPTVIFYNAEGNEIGRGHTPQEIEEILVSAKKEVVA